MIRHRSAAATALFAAGLLAGCGTGPENPKAASPAGRPSSDDVAAERAKLPPADLALVEAQEWCAVNDGERLGSMGPPLKLDVKGRPVFVCCKGCRKRAEADPDETLAKVEELKAKAKAEREAKR